MQETILETRNEEARKAMIARIESAISRGAEDYFRRNGFVRIESVPHMVNITGACENVNTLYSLDYHGKEAFLTQTGQTALELLMPYIDRVCCTIHSFRAEEAVDNRHLTEFPLVELEFKYGEYQNGFEMLLHHIEATISAMVANALNEERETLQQLGVDIGRLESIRRPFQRVSYDEAVKLLKIPWGSDLKADHEAWLVKKFGDQPLFVTRYPESIKFFNMQRNKQNPLLVNSTDLLLPFAGESVGAAVREHDYGLLVEKLRHSQMFKILKAKGKTLEDFKSYLNAVKNQPTPHAGCGIGLPRVTQFVLGSSDIRESTAYPMNKDSL